MRCRTWPPPARKQRLFDDAARLNARAQMIRGYR